jgi:hypothetical protein
MLAAMVGDVDRRGLRGLAPTDDVHGLDGSELLIEATDGDNHVIFVRWTPEYDSAARGLTGVVALYRKWFRECGFWE